MESTAGTSFFKASDVEALRIIGSQAKGSPLSRQSFLTVKERYSQLIYSAFPIVWISKVSHTSRAVMEAPQVSELDVHWSQGLKGTRTPIKSDAPRFKG